MIVTAALCWWNEKPADLVACIKGIANIADRLVAVDGAYRRYPGATVRSPDSQVVAIRQAAKEAGLKCIVHRPSKLWAGQVEKRTFLLREAARGSDWIVVVDTDHIISTNRAVARRALAKMPAKVRCVGVEFFTPANKRRKIEQSAATTWHVGASGRTIQMAQIFRSYPDYRVDKKHWIYRALNDTLEMRYGGTADRPIGVPYTVEHRTLFRTKAQMLASRAFCNDRVLVVARTGQEDDVPGLPAPVWDYRLDPTTATRPTDGVINERERAQIMDLPVIAKPPPAWSKTSPNHVIAFGEAARGLEKGYPVAVRMRGSGLLPDIRNGDVVAFGQPDVIKVGDIVLARVRAEIVAQRVVGVVGDRYQVSDRRLQVRLASKVYGVLTYSGPHWPDWKPKIVTKSIEVEQPVTVTAPVKRKPGRPKGSGRKAAAVK